MIACGALARDIQRLKRTRGWEHLHLTCIDAALHNRPQLIGERVRAKIDKHRDAYAQIFVAYADCGTRGEIDRICQEEGAERLPGAHCYQFFAGEEQFARLAEEEPGTFFLTDFLARHFDRLIVKALRLDDKPELRDLFFGNYRRLVYLAQTYDEALRARAQRAARYLGLEFQVVHCGYGQLEVSLGAQIGRRTDGEKNPHLLA